jgi:hypothetical protein
MGAEGPGICADPSSASVHSCGIEFTDGPQSTESAVAIPESLKRFTVPEWLKHLAARERLRHFAVPERLRHLAVPERLKHLAVPEWLRHLAGPERLKYLAVPLWLEHLAISIWPKLLAQPISGCRLLEKGDIDGGRSFPAIPSTRGSPTPSTRGSPASPRTIAFVLL